MLDTNWIEALIGSAMSFYLGWSLRPWFDSVGRKKDELRRAEAKQTVGLWLDEARINASPKDLDTNENSLEALDCIINRPAEYPDWVRERERKRFAPDFPPESDGWLPFEYPRWMQERERDTLFGAYKND